ncbi:MAG TPA: methylmalonyl-CoA mutase family protein [Lacipirellulaceae bacterium]|nr:methylmalonyl-CoA mutase family protein [Lacipirellulaceae bacterium]
MKNALLRNQAAISSVSGVPVNGLYTLADLNGFDPERELGRPGQFPYTRGIHESMYRERLWTMRQFAGFGRPVDTNGRFRFLFEQGQTGLSTAFDLPTLMGLDSDDPRSLGEVGRLGVAVDTIDDMLALFDQIDLDRASVSMTINAPAIVIMAFYLAAARARGYEWRVLQGTIQNDILKEFHSQNEIVFPPEPSVRLVIDLIEFCTADVPKWNSVSISGYHIREAGSTATQELAFTLADGRHYVEQCLERGLDIDTFAPRLSFFFNAHNDLFEEVAKYRAARALWAESMRDQYGAKAAASWKLRFHAQTAGCTLQAQQPQVNLVRVAYQALEAVLGGCQSLHTNSMDETLALPSEEAVTLALRTQQVLAHETGVANTVDPLGGSYFIEAFTQRMKEAAREYFRAVDEQGGMIAAVENGYFRRQIAGAAYAQQQAIDNREKLIVGVNAFEQRENESLSLMEVDANMEAAQVESLRNIKRQRSLDDVSRSLDQLRKATEAGKNVMPALLEAADNRVTVQECMDALADILGRFRPSAPW